MEASKKLRMLGLATRAGKVVTGLDLCEKSVRQKKARLIVIAEDAADSTKKKFLSFGLPVVYVSDMMTLGKFTGKDVRSVCTVCDKELAKAIQESEETKC